MCKPGGSGDPPIAEALDWLDRLGNGPSVLKPSATSKFKEAPEVVTIALPQALTLPITPAISLSPSRENDVSQMSRVHVDFAHFKIDFNFCGPFGYVTATLVSAYLIIWFRFNVPSDAQSLAHCLPLRK